MYVLKQIFVLVLILPSLSFANALNNANGSLKASAALSFPVEKTQMLKQTIDGINMVLLPGGCYLYPEITNYEDKYTNVCVKSFWVGAYEITQEQWLNVMGKNPAFFKKCGKSCPVEQVSWDDIQVFIQKLNQKTGKRFRLPTDNEWMYACLADKSAQKYCGSSDEPDSFAWYSDNSSKKTHKVAQKLPNGFGLYDMNGNVWEWVSDRYYDKSDISDNDTPGRNSRRAHRGGSWHDSVWRLRLTFKNGQQSDFKSNTLGFRLAFDPILNKEK